MTFVPRMERVMDGRELRSITLFRPTLQRQRDDAAEKGQVARLTIFDGLLDRLDTNAKAS